MRRHSEEASKTLPRAIPGKGWFVEHFALMIELTRMLTNLPGSQRGES